MEEGIIEAVRSPIAFMALAILVCNAVFAVCALRVKEDKQMEAFKYAIHMFLAVVSIFALIAVWCPASLYHPKDFVDIEAYKELQQAPLIPTIIAVTGLILYMVYQICKYIGKRKIEGK